MPDVTPPELVEQRKQFQRVHPDSLPLTQPPECDLCERPINAYNESYVVAPDGSWAHIQCVSDVLNEEEVDGEAQTDR